MQQWSVTTSSSATRSRRLPSESADVSLISCRSRLFNIEIYTRLNVVRGRSQEFATAGDKGGRLRDFRPQWGPWAEPRWGFGAPEAGDMLISSYDGGHGCMSPLATPLTLYDSSVEKLFAQCTSQ